MLEKVSNWLAGTYRDYGVLGLLSIFCLLIGLSVGVYFLIVINWHFAIASKNGAISMPETGQIGDFFGGVVGTFFALSGTFFLLLTLNFQIREAKKAEKRHNEILNA